MTHLAARVGEDSPLFELFDAAFAIDGKQLLQPTRLALARGRVYGLIGHNGSGKTTLLKLIASQQPPTSGEIRFLGRPLAQWSRREFARKVGYLPQHPPAANGMIVRELVALGRYPWHGPLGRFSTIDREKTEDAMALTDVSSMADRLVDTLSGGERQRVWVAMLVAQDAECLLLDEPISALDVGHQLQVLELVRRLADRGLSVVVVLHDVNMATRFCDELIALHSGRLARRGTPKEIMTEDALLAIYDVPMMVFPRPDTGAPVGFAR